jgi:hypothetical protein
MRQVIGVLTILTLGLPASASGADEFRYRVFRSKPLKAEAGQLEISGTGVFYRSDDGKTAIRVALQDILEVDVSRSDSIRIKTYDILKRRLAGRRTYEFRLRDGKHEETLAQFLTNVVPRPVVGSFATASKGTFSIPAYHRHRLGGCHGSVEIGVDSIRFKSDKPEDSRTWLYRDIETIGAMTPFHFRVSTLTETYNFDLKDRLPADAYQLAWQKLYCPPDSQRSGGAKSDLVNNEFISKGDHHEALSFRRSPFAWKRSPGLRRRADNQRASDRYDVRCKPPSDGPWRPENEPA